MKNNEFETILDAYQLVKGAQIRAKKYPEEIYIMDAYQPDKRAYMVYPLDNGVSFQDFGVLINESEMMMDYEIGSVKTAEVAIDVDVIRKVA